MAGTKEGAMKTAATNKAKYGEDYYRLMGAKGGKASKGGGFASLKEDSNGLTGPERARLYGAKGGSISKRGKGSKKNENNIIPS